MEQVVLDVGGVDSPDAERAVTTALINVPGVEWATAAASADEVAVRYDPSAADESDLRAALAAEGFGPEHRRESEPR